MITPAEIRDDVVALIALRNALDMQVEQFAARHCLAGGKGEDKIAETVRELLEEDYDADEFARELAPLLPVFVPDPQDEPWEDAVSGGEF